MKKSTFISAVITSVLLSSCATQNLFETSTQGHMIDLMKTDTAYHHVIASDDKVSLSIWNHDDMSVGSVFSIYNSNEAYGKWVLVDQTGYVQLPKIGRQRIAGLSCPKAAELLESQYAEFLVDPVIVVKVLNREVTVLGEVRTPGTYLLEKERNTITEIAGKAQGFMPYADLEKVQVIRKGVSYTLDFTRLTPEMLHTLVLESGDIVNVPSLKRKGLDTKAPTLIPFASTATALAIVASIIL